MSIEWVRRTMIVPAGKVGAARAMVEQLAPGQGDGMFLTGLSADGGEPATHFVSSGSILREFGDLLDAPPSHIAGFLTDCVIVDPGVESPRETFTRLGLHMVVSTEL